MKKAIATGAKITAIGSSSWTSSPCSTVTRSASAYEAHRSSPPIAAGSSAVSALPATPRATTRRSSARHGRHARSRRRSAEVRGASPKVTSTMREFGRPPATPRARRWAVFAALLACASVGAGRAPAAASNQSAPNPFALPPERLLAAGDPMPKTAFVDQTGAVRTLDDYRGQTSIIGFVYTSCKDECPLITRKFGSLERLLPAGRFHFIEVSIDPAHDSPRVLATYARRYDVDPARRTLLTGSPEAIDAFER